MNLKVLLFICFLTFTNICQVNARVSPDLPQEFIEYNESDLVPCLPPEQFPIPHKMICFDGGGIRGLFSLHVAKKIEEKLGTPLSQAADYFSGTSTGGMIAIGYGLGRETDEMMKLYTLKKDQIFYRSWHRIIKSKFGLTDEKYDTKHLEKLLIDFYGSDTTLRDITYGNVIIPATNITKDQPLFFDSYSAKFNKEYDYPLWQVGRSTSAAPTYFEPTNIRGDAVVDGGLIANNPTIAALAKIKSHYGWECMKNMKVLSIGTGEHVNSISYKDAKNMGILMWAAPISKKIMHTSTNMFDELTMDLLDDPQQYLRLNTKLKHSIKLDGILPGQIRQIEDAAQEYIQNNPDKIDAAVKMLRD